MKDQSHSSRNTSINCNKLPAVYGKLDKMGVNSCAILDYGCGKYLVHIQDWCRDRGVDYLPYDPFNQPEEVNTESMRKAAKAANAAKLIIVCSNVLNVIDSDDVVRKILGTFYSFKAPAYITIFEGKGNGVGRETGSDQYQRNQKLKAYEAYVPKDAKVSFKYGMMCMGV